MKIWEEPPDRCTDETPEATREVAARGHTSGSTSLASFDSILLQFPPSFPKSISRSDHLTFMMFCKFGENFAVSERCQQILVKGMRLRRGSIGVWGVVLITPLSPERPWSRGEGGQAQKGEAGGLGSGFHYAAEGGALVKTLRVQARGPCLSPAWPSLFSLPWRTATLVGRLWPSLWQEFIVT